MNFNINIHTPVHAGVYYFYGMNLNIEIKARCSDAGFIRAYLNGHGADFKGTDHQTDTYFNVYHGRLKLREGNIENNLIYYERPDQPGPKSSDFKLVEVQDAAGLKESLARSLGIKKIIRKKRDIYFIDNVKFHIDEVAGLGSFVEIEASNLKTDRSRQELLAQCKTYLEAFLIPPQDLLEGSYSDML